MIGTLALVSTTYDGDFGPLNIHRKHFCLMLYEILGTIIGKVYDSPGFPLKEDHPSIWAIRVPLDHTFGPKTQVETYCSSPHWMQKVESCWIRLFTDLS